MKETYEWGRYVIYPKTGQVFNKETEREIAPHKATIALTLEDKRRVIYKKAKFIWEIVNGKTASVGDVFVALDGDDTNCAIDNIKVVERTKYFEGHNWECKVKLSRDEVQAIKDKFATGEISSLNLALEYNVGKSTIQKILTGKYYYDMQEKKCKK